MQRYVFFSAIFAVYVGWCGNLGLVSVCTCMFLALVLMRFVWVSNYLASLLSLLIEGGY